MPFSHVTVAEIGFEMTLLPITYEWALQTTPFPITGAPPPITPEWPGGEPTEPVVFPYPITGQAWPLLVTTPTPQDPYPPEQEPEV